MPAVPTQHLRKILEDLRGELESAQPADEAQRELLAHAVRDVEALLARADAAPGREHRSLLERLREATREFETSHPALTTAAGRVMDALANMGI